MPDNQTIDTIDMVDVLRRSSCADQGATTLSRDMSDAQSGSAVRADLKIAGGRVLTVIPPQGPQYDEFHEFLKASDDDKTKSQRASLVVSQASAEMPVEFNAENPGR